MVHNWLITTQDAFDDDYTAYQTVMWSGETSTDAVDEYLSEYPDDKETNIVSIIRQGT